MIEVAEIFRLHGPAYRAKFSPRMLPSHRRAMQDIEQCRTASLGGQLYFCQQCQQQRYSYHSCKNRHCPKCGNEQATVWLQAQQHLLLPTHYFLVTFTLPAALRPLARSQQRTIYNLLFRAASQALLQLAQDPRFCGGLIGMVGVLHTWTRALLYHPHVHFIVTGGGLSQDHRWLASRKDFLVPVKALSTIFRAKFREQLRQSDLFQQVPAQVWRQDWVVHSQPIGSGLTMADVARTLDLPVLLVVGMRLGCLNHALLTCESIDRRGLKLAGWVASCIDPSMPRREQNVTALRECIAAPLLGVADYDPAPDGSPALDFAVLGCAGVQG